MNNSGMSFSSKKPEELQIAPQVGVNPLTGAAVIDVPLRVTPGRSGFGPSLALQYSSSASHSVFGEGWSLTGLPAIGLTGKQHPSYDGKDEVVCNGTEELVPVLREEAGVWRPRIENRDDFWVHYYRSKKEVAFTRFEKWVHKASGRVHWRSRDSADVLSVYGLRSSGESRIADPNDPERTYLWQLDAQYDDHGNAIVYDYIAENSDNIDFQQTAELDRLRRDNGFPQRYLKRIRYGNTKPLGVDMPEHPENRWLFEVTFDYGDHGEDEIPSPVASQSWPARLDPYSNYRAGFEVRTYRLCRRILMFHNFTELAAEPTLVGSTELDHHEDAVGSTLQSIRYTGYRRDPATGQISCRSLPPIKFDYSSACVERTFQAAPEQTKENFPSGLSDTRYRWVDLHGEGLPGILTESNQAWYYKPNLGNGRFGPQQKAAEKPSQRIGGYSLSDLDGDGNLNLIVLEGRQAGYCEYDRDRGEWLSFRPFASAPHLDLDNGNTRLLDINGDGLPDILVSDQDHLTWYPSEGKDGFGAPVELARPRIAGQPQVIGENPALSFFFADMTGDGMLDQVRIQNGRVEYWPQLGNGRFGDGVVMDNAPIIDYDTAFDPNRLRLVDIDGNGTADLLYIGRGEVRYWINANGNRFVEGGRLTDLPYIDNLSSVELLDFLGDGESCLVWSSPLTVFAESPIHYLRLTSGVVPRLLIQVDNSMGQVTELCYSSSSQHYLRDKEMGRGWISKLPSHVQVVDEKVVRDLIGGSRLVTRYEYHDGRFDGEKREFRGFGLVDQYDAELFTEASVPEAQYTPPSCTRTWFHNGAFGWDAWRARDYHRGDPQHAVLPAPVIEEPSALESDAFEQGYRALAGQIIRRETFAVSSDGRRATHPFQVQQTAYHLRQVQPSLDRQDACFTFYAAESLTHEYEQQPDDPRIAHNFTLEVDYYGHPLRTCTVAYPRRSSATDAVAAQQQYYFSALRQGCVHIDEADRYELGIPVESKQFELTGLRPEHNGLFQWGEIATALGPLLTAPLGFHVDLDAAGDTPQARLVGWNRNYYWNDEASSDLPVGGVGRTTLLHHQETAAFDDSLRAEVFGDGVGETLLGSEGRYAHRDGYWWQPSPVQHYLTADGFHHLAREERTDGGRTEYVYDAPNYLVMRETVDAMRNRTRADIDYNLIAPYRITDPNESIAEVLYDPLGVIVVSTVQGSIQRPDGTPALYGHDRLSIYTVQPEADLSSILAEPARFLQNAGQFFHYELETWERSGLPLRNISLVREELVHDGRGGGIAAGPIQTSLAHVDGYGRILQEKRSVEPGPAIRRDDRGAIVLDENGYPEEAEVTDRWLVSGHTVYNNKQQPIRQYEPFFSCVPDFEPDSELQRFGVSTHSFYDPVGRLIQQSMPNGTLTRVEITPWDVRHYDPNDTVDESLYKVYRETLPGESPEKQALDKARTHANTPVIVRLDPLGREIVHVDTSGDGVNRVTENHLDSPGNVIAITDPRRLTAFTYRRDMLGQIFHEHSIDAGDSLNLFDVLGRTIHRWDGRGVHIHISYDTLDRPISVHVDGALGLNQVVERMTYGDNPEFADAALKNARGRLVEHYDEAGLQVIHQYNPEGTPLRTERRLLENYKSEPDWTAPAAVFLEPSSFIAQTKYDALGRETEQQLPDGTTRFISYLPSGGVARVGIATADGVLDNVSILEDSSFNARGQRTRSVLGNGVETTWHYDSETFRMQRLTASQPTSSGAGGSRVYQDVEYTYDPVGNVTHLADQAQQPEPAPTPVLQGLRVSPDSSFTYDAFYQLKAATGRVHQALEQHDHRAGLAYPCMKGTRHLNLNNGAAVERYTRTYDYDLSGNIQRIRHQSATDSARSWTTEMSISPSSNRSLPALDDNGLPITNLESRFDPSGNCTSLSHLRAMDWNYRNNLSRALFIDRSAEERPDDAEYYVYGGDGMRIRKVHERVVNGEIEITEKIYLDGCEIKRIRRNGSLLLERTTSHLTDGVNRIALLHQWTVDNHANETDDISQKKIHYQLSNHLGSSSLELDESGQVISYEEYFPFGGSAFVAGNNVRDVRLKEYRYSGKERDDNTGFYYYGYRYYAPWTGNWLSPDPIGPEDGLNLYEFVSNNPVNSADLNGLVRGNLTIRGTTIEELSEQYRNFSTLPEEVQREILLTDGTLAFTPTPEGGEVIPRADGYRLEEERRASGTNVIRYEYAPPPEENPEEEPPLYPGEWVIEEDELVIVGGVTRESEEQRTELEEGSQSGQEGPPREPNAPPAESTGFADPREVNSSPGDSRSAPAILPTYESPPPRSMWSGATESRARLVAGLERARAELALRRQAFEHPIEIEPIPVARTPRGPTLQALGEAESREISLGLHQEDPGDPVLRSLEEHRPLYQGVFSSTAYAYSSLVNPNNPALNDASMRIGEFGDIALQPRTGIHVPGAARVGRPLQRENIPNEVGAPPRGGRGSGRAQGPATPRSGRSATPIPELELADEAPSPENRRLRRLLERLRSYEDSPSNSVVVTSPLSHSGELDRATIGHTANILRRTGFRFRRLRPNAFAGTDDGTLVLHGRRERGGFGIDAVSLGPEYGFVSADRLAEILVNDLGWTGGTLRLAACNAAVPRSDGGIYAQELADALAGRGARTTVLAPRGRLATYRGGVFGVRPPEGIGPHDIRTEAWTPFGPSR